MDPDFPDEFLIEPDPEPESGTSEKPAKERTQHDEEQDAIQNDFETQPITVRTDLGGGFEDDENIFTTSTTVVSLRLE